MIQRVNGSLAVSRALGDFEYKNVDGKGPTEQLVSPEPEFYMKKREADNDEFLVLGKFSKHFETYVIFNKKKALPSIIRYSASYKLCYQKYILAFIRF